MVLVENFIMVCNNGWKLFYSGFMVDGNVMILN